MKPPRHKGKDKIAGRGNDNVAEEKGLEKQSAREESRPIASQRHGAITESGESKLVDSISQSLQKISVSPNSDEGSISLVSNGQCEDQPDEIKIDLKKKKKKKKKNTIGADAFSGQSSESTVS